MNWGGARTLTKKTVHKSTKENALKMLKLKSRKSIFSSHAKKPKNKKWKMWLGIVKFRGCSFPAQTLKPRFNLWTLFFYDLRNEVSGEVTAHTSHNFELDNSNWNPPNDVIPS